MADVAPEFPARAPADPRSVMAELESLIGFHISLANTAIKAHFQSQSVALGLTHKQIAILWIVGGCPGIIQSDLARMLQVKRATMWGMVGRLCERDLLERPGSEAVDARHVALTLTETGRDVLAQAKAAILQHEGWVKQPFTAQEQQVIAKLMTKIHQRRA
jgi:DNA-binding MarR family transcriptional regulator